MYKPIIETVNLDELKETETRIYDKEYEEFLFSGFSVN